jgi:small-conductance mechanosensitive channel
MTMLHKFLTLHWEQLVAPALILAVTLALGYAAKRIMLRLLGRWAARSTGSAAKLASNALMGPFMIWVLILGIHMAIENSHLPMDASQELSNLLVALWVLSFTISASRLAGELIALHGSGLPGALPVTSLSQTLAQLAVIIFGVLLLLDLLHISITPILTALGVGGLAVALALQDTLSNLFAGFYVTVARQVRPGDYIRLNTGEEGYTADIGWRNTTVRTLANNLIIIPNSKLGQANVTNFSLPDKRMGASIQVSVSYASDPDHVERVLLEEAQAAARELPGLLADPAPGVSCDPGFGDWALSFTVGYSVREFGDQVNVRAELRKRILRRLRQEKIDVPFPTRTIYMHSQGDT